jgi:hypothetical protein
MSPSPADFFVQIDPVRIHKKLDSTKITIDKVNIDFLIHLWVQASTQSLLQSFFY